MEQFEELSAEVPHVTNDVLEEIFLQGLKRHLREQVVRYRPSGINDIVDIAKMVEDQEKETMNYNSKPFQCTSSSPVIQQSSKPLHQGVNKGNEQVTPARKSFDNARDLRNNGTHNDPRRSSYNPCRYCGERYFAGHKCKSNHRLKCLEVDEEDESEEEGDEEEHVQVEKGSQKNVGEELLTLSICSMVGLSEERTMKMSG
ncbi:hypothetical protein N665_0993s0001, partial [Sinapis alba]